MTLPIIPQLTLYPDFDDVFVGSHSIHKMLFFPLLTVNLESINKGAGKVHFVSVSCDGNPDFTYPNDSFNYNFIRFLWDGERYDFNTDLNFISHFKQIPSWYDEVLADFSQNKNDYLRHKSSKEAEEIFGQFSKQRYKQSFEYRHYYETVLSYLVAKANYDSTGLFINSHFFLHGDDYINSSEDVINKPIVGSLSKTGLTKRANELIGKVIGYHYLHGGEDEISLYIDRKTNTVFEKFNWT